MNSCHHISHCANGLRELNCSQDDMPHGRQIAPTPTQTGLCK